MTTHQVRDPTVIHFTIDGRHGILGARHIAEALHIPYEPAHPEDYRVWTHPSQSDIIHILSRGAFHMPVSVGEELPSSMFFIDALLRHNIFPLQHWVQRRGVLLEALFRIFEGFFFGPHHLIMAAFCTLKRRSIGRSCLERMLFHFSSPDCYVRFWSTWGTHQSLSLSAEPGAPTGAEHPEIPHPDQPEEPQPVEILADMRAPAPTMPSTKPIPEALTTSQSILTQQMISLRAHQEQIITTQTQHTAILRQIQHHLADYRRAEASNPSIPSSAAEPSSSHHHPPTI
ncbi:hypothetical protein CK203_062860 [Vitis vinifera]|uniref:Uncharacterized protein n=1 Tax=Vitis vinifera TaxID=29760 RepID=A0A438FSL2_VITVI|nr:hypothetical protein CK203_062860 [Vitis vinifera]